MKRLANAARLAALLAVVGACGSEAIEPAVQPGGGGGGDGTGGSGGTLPGDPPSWERAEVRQRWLREGLGWGNTAIAHDWDGDGNDELVLGGRGVALIDPAHLGAHPIWSLDWEGRTEWEFAYGLRRFDGNGDGTQDILVVGSDRAAYLVDGTTGERLWYRFMDTGFLPARMADFDADADGVPDFFTAGDDKVWSGATGEELFDLDLPIIVAAAATAELDGQPGRDLVVGVELDGPIDGPPSSGAQVFGFAKGEKLWELSTEGMVGAVAAADVDGDGIDEAIAGTNAGWLYVGGANGVAWSVHLGQGAVTRVAAGDVDGDGRAEVFAAFMSYLDMTPTKVIAFRPTGEQMWWYGVEPVFVEGFGLVQLDDDPAPELLVTCGRELRGTYSGFAAALETPADAPRREQWKVDPALPVYGYAPLHRDGKLQLALFAEDGRVRGVDAATGATQWLYYAGDFVMAIAAGDATGDGVPDVARGDQRGNLHLVDGKDGSGLWSRRLDAPSTAMTTAIAMGDLDADGVADVAVGGYRSSTQRPGILEVYSNRGALLWSRDAPGWITAVAIHDLDGDGQAEVLAVEDAGTCTLHALSAGGAPAWSTPISTCGAGNYLDVADVDGDGAPEIAYAAPPFFEPPDIALIEGDGRLVWNVEVEDAAWVRAMPGGVVTGGGATEWGGFVARHASVDGAEVWRHRVEPIPDPDYPDGQPLGNPVWFGDLVPDQNGDGVPEVAASALRNDLYLLDGVTGAPMWSVWLEPKDLHWGERPAGGPVVYVPATENAPAWLATAQFAETNMGTKIRALRVEDGFVIAEFPTQSQAYVGAAMPTADGQGAVFGAGVSVYAVEAVPK